MRGWGRQRVGAGVTRRGGGGPGVRARGGEVGLGWVVVRSATRRRVSAGAGAAMRTRRPRLRAGGGAAAALSALCAALCAAGAAGGPAADGTVGAPVPPEQAALRMSASALHFPAARLTRHASNALEHAISDDALCTSLSGPACLGRGGNRWAELDATARAGQSGAFEEGGQVFRVYAASDIGADSASDETNVVNVLTLDTRTEVGRAAAAATFLGLLASSAQLRFVHAVDRIEEVRTSIHWQRLQRQVETAAGAVDGERGGASAKVLKDADAADAEAGINRGGMLVMYYSPECLHCVQAHDAIVEAAGMLLRGHGLRTFAINCAKHQSMCESAGVTQMPDIRFFFPRESAAGLARDGGGSATSEEVCAEEGVSQRQESTVEPGGTIDAEEVRALEEIEQLRHEEVSGVGGEAGGKASSASGGGGKESADIATRPLAADLLPFVRYYPQGFVAQRSALEASWLKSCARLVNRLAQEQGLHGRDSDVREKGFDEYDWSADDIVAFALDVAAAAGLIELPVQHEHTVHLSDLLKRQEASDAESDGSPTRVQHCLVGKIPANERVMTAAWRAALKGGSKEVAESLGSFNKARTSVEVRMLSWVHLSSWPRATDAPERDSRRCAAALRVGSC